MPSAEHLILLAIDGYGDSGVRMQTLARIFKARLPIENARGRYEVPKGITRSVIEKTVSKAIEERRVTVKRDSNRNIRYLTDTGPLYESREP
jgi:hypothetical protein